MYVFVQHSDILLIFLMQGWTVTLMYPRRFRWFVLSALEWYRLKHSTDLSTWLYSTTLKHCRGA